MIALACQHSDRKKHGKSQTGKQRYKCRSCGITFLDERDPIAGVRVPREKAILALRMILEGSSVRSTSRITRLHRDTICKLVVLLGERCEDLMDSRVRHLPVKDVQVDETWGFVYCKKKTSKRLGYGEETGDAYTFVAIERHTKLALCWHVGKRDADSTFTMLTKLKRATTGHFQLTTDAFRFYSQYVPGFFLGRVDYAQVIKVYGVNRSRGVDPSRTSAARYSPADIIDTKKIMKMGDPDRNRACTSHIERLNLSIRTGMRRMTRLTCAFSKKWENHAAAMALYLTYYNFCWVHGTLGTTPAQAAGLTNETWTVEKLLEEAATVS